MVENIQEEIEDKIIDVIALSTGGRLVVFKPEKKGLEDYLAVERRGEYKEKEMYFLIGSTFKPMKKGIFVKDFLQESFKAEKNFYLLFVYFDEVLQKINDYIWLVPSLQFRDIAEVVESQEGKKLLRFQAPLDIKKKDKYSKYIVETKELGKLMMSALESGGKFTFKEIDYTDKSNINLESLVNFLCEARKSTFAANANSLDNPRLLASKQLEFQKGDYFYRDIFFNGNKKFIGQEIIYQELRPIWGMNYMGDQIGRLEAGFLRESLFRLAEKCRLGKSCEYEKREYKYSDQGKGSIDDFSGVEEITVQDKKIYKLNYQGGIILDKI
ncbi:MAG: DUF5680 domain-containing protein [Candidatus Staskawiczbacteria bacterium]|nr:DUF5680 domain-containing protein [Candidatus Staskawiczbacteria bacterium]